MDKTEKNGKEGDKEEDKEEELPEKEKVKDDENNKSADTEEVGAVHVYYNYSHPALLCQRVFSLCTTSSSHILKLTTHVGKKWDL